MIPRLLVPWNARPPAADAPSSRRRPTTLDERTLVPAMLPIVQLDGHSNIPSSLPLEAIAARTVVPRGIRREEFAIEERSELPLQPTDLDERITVPQGAAPPEIIMPSENILPAEIVDPDIFMTGEVNLLTTPRTEEKTKSEVVRSVSSVLFHVLLILAIIVEPKMFPPRPKTQDELDLARRQMTILLPPGTFDAPKPAPRVKERPSESMRVDPRVLRKVAPPEPQPPPPPKQPERVVKELPSAPVPKPNATPPPQEQAPVAKTEAPKQPLKLEKPEEQPTTHGLLLPKNSPGQSIQDSIREAAKMNAPSAVGGGGRLPSNSGLPGGGSQGTAYGAMQMLTPTEGVDFNDYLNRVYITVKRNWFAVMPESVRLGDKGVVSLQFRIMRDGTVPVGEPAKVFGSGKEPLDRAAISSIRASNPFEPLPPAFSGPYIELRFTYYYNLQPDYSH
jgi:outer membrane biosynthesis protein TonB